MGTFQGTGCKIRMGIIGLSLTSKYIDAYSAYLIDGCKKDRLGEHQLPAVFHFGKTGLIINYLVNVNALVEELDIGLAQAYQFGVIQHCLCIQWTL
jgi:hypothetical protein